ncbi:2-hydroxyacyl-CoA lyase 1-like isoform X2 [Clinocottus analis]|uniref:2-hydroxyacyl-CoA lyase 1-like isoform X2 n=1 Tax=Clinocottus analis TaxID=304258 RepID=UPI0035BFB1BC
MYGRPGACYVDIAGDMVNAKVDRSQVRVVSCCPSPPVSLAHHGAIAEAISVTRAAKRPLVIIGKGAAYGRAETALKEFVEITGLPFLPTPMGKGVLPDDHPNCVSAARSSAPPVTLLPEARYDEVMTAFGGQGFLVRTVEELRSALQLSLSDWERPSLLNVLIDPSSDRKEQGCVTDTPH